MTTRIQVSDSGLEVIPPRDTLTQGSENTITLEFEFAGAWLLCNEYNAVFTDDINSATVPVTGGACVIPVEVLQNPWRFVSLSLNGTSASGVITSPFVRIGQVLPSASGGEGGKFVTMAQLMEILQGYVKAEDLGVYVTHDELQAALETYAKQADVDSLDETKADKTTVAALAGTVAAQGVEIQNKADAATVTALETRIGTNETNIAALQNGKADKEQLEGYWSKAEIGLQTDGDGKQFLANDGKYYEVQGGGGDEKTFIAEYNVTTAQEIIDYIDASKEPFAPILVKRGTDYYTVTTASKQGDNKIILVTFASLSGNYYTFTYTITNGTWASASYGFQKMLESGTNIKTVNGESLLGGGDIQIQGGTQEQANWNEADSTSPAYIQNKPTIPDVTGLATQASVDAVSDTVSAIDTRVGTAETNITALQKDKADASALEDYETTTHAEATYETKADASKIKSVTAAGFAVTPDSAGNVNIGGTDVSRTATSGSWGSEIIYTIAQTLPAGASSDTKGSVLTVVKRTENSGATPRIKMTVDGVQLATSADVPDVSNFATLDYVQNNYETTAHASATYLKIAEASPIKSVSAGGVEITPSATGNVAVDAPYYDSGFSQRGGAESKIFDHHHYVGKTTINGVNSYMSVTYTDDDGFYKDAEIGVCRVATYDEMNAVVTAAASPIKSITVGGETVAPDTNGNVAIAAPQVSYSDATNGFQGWASKVNTDGTSVAFSHNYTKNGTEKTNLEFDIALVPAGSSVLPTLVSKVRAVTWDEFTAQNSPIKSITYGGDAITPDANGNVALTKTTIALSSVPTSPPATSCTIMAADGNRVIFGVTNDAKQARLAWSVDSNTQQVNLATEEWVQQYVASLDGTNIAA